MAVWGIGELRAQDSRQIAQEIELIFKDMKVSDRKTLEKNSVSAWGSGFFTAEEKEEMKALFGEMQELRLSPLGELLKFAECVHYFHRKNEKENWAVWYGGMKEAAANNERKRLYIKDYLDKTHRMLYEQVFYTGNTFKWYVKGDVRLSRSGEEIRWSIPDATVICRTNRDAIQIVSSSVEYVFGKNRLSGSGGRVDWRNEKPMYADLSSYTIDMGEPEYVADSVLFYYEGRLPEPVLGELKDKALAFVQSKNREYPQFTSRNTDVDLGELFKYLSYRGGIVYTGEKLSGFGRDEQWGCVTIQPNDTTFMYIYSRRFTIDSARIMAATSRLVLPMDSSELVHPHIHFTYTEGNRTALFRRMSEQSQHIPFRNGYHRILFDVEQMIWKIDESTIGMGMSSRSGLFKAKIESMNFFNDNVYDQMTGLDELHPLNGLHRTSVKLGKTTFSIQEYVGEMRKPADQLRKQIVLLSYGDFVEYDEELDQITLKPRLFDYTAARIGKQDYDDLKFDSHPKDSRVNAVLDLRNYRLEIFGVEQFTISTTKDIFAEPSDRKVVMLKNRDMEFSGMLKAGMFDMYGSNLFFSYDKYTIDMPHIDSSTLYVSDQVTGKRGERVNSLIRNMVGDIEIDKPNNKSGKQDTEVYPILNTRKDSYVYFDDTTIRKGAYRREQFHFIIHPFTLRNINDDTKFAYAFGGTLVSNIVPDVKDSLRLMEDHSLGMKFKTPVQGFALYEEGLITSTLRLDKSGFVADGDITMNSSRFGSGQIILEPDSMMTSTQLVQVDALSGKRPGTQGNDVKVKYLKKQGNLQLTSQDKPFFVYDDRVKLEGKLNVFKELMDGTGRMELREAQMVSQAFKLQEQRILSAKTALRMCSPEYKNVQMNTGDVSIDIDLVANKGLFANNADTARLHFPYNRYRASFRNVTWYLDSAYLNIGMETEEELSRMWKLENEASLPLAARNRFVTTERAKDSLSFVAPQSLYSLTEGDIRSKWVNHIDIANGRFYPPEGNVQIAANGLMQAFKEGELLCDRVDRSKKLTNVELVISGRYRFSGSGDFEYVNQDKKKQTIRFDQLRTDSLKHIYAYADLPSDRRIELNDGILFKGKVALYSKQPNLEFNGYTGLAQAPDTAVMAHRWMRVKTSFVPDDIRVPVELENRDDKDQRIYSGIYLNIDKTVRPYARFQGPRIFYTDEAIIGGRGEMLWRPAERKYIIEDTLFNRWYHVSYFPDKNEVTAFGRIQLGFDVPGIGQLTSGDITYDLAGEKLAVRDAVMVWDFRMPGRLEELFLQDLTAAKNKKITVSEYLLPKFSALYSRNMMPVLQRQLSKVNNNVPDSLEQLLVFDGLDLKWDEVKRSYLTNGRGTLLASRNKPVDRKCEVKMELLRRRSGNTWSIYLADDDFWYYFEMTTEKTLYALSSNPEFNEALKQEKVENKEIRDAEKKIQYTLTLCPDSRLNRFMKRISGGMESEPEPESESAGTEAGADSGAGTDSNKE